MNGEIGVLYQDKQIGGVYNWRINLTYEPTVRDGYHHLKVKKTIIAQSYWLIETPSDNIYDIELYKRVNKQLVLMDAGKVRIRFPDCKTLNRRLDAPIEIRWIGVEY